MTTPEFISRSVTPWVALCTVLSAGSLVANGFLLWTVTQRDGSPAPVHLNISMGVPEPGYESGDIPATAGKRGSAVVNGRRIW